MENKGFGKEKFQMIYTQQINDVETIDIFKWGSTAIFGTRGANGVISISTKRGSSSNSENDFSPNYTTIFPFGYQQPVEYYAPKYDVPEKRFAPTMDLRTTIHWQPVVKTDSQGEASFEFYTADEQTSYTVTIEGLANDGSIIRYIETLWKE